MGTLRQFIYLDEDKMYSLSSQLFAGFTDFVVEYKESSTSQQEEQKGPFGSGRVLADLALQKSGQQERRFLHDYAYTLFEAELASQRSIIEVNNTQAIPTLDKISTASFIKVVGATEFNDMKAISDLIGKFNEFGKALTYVTTHAERVQAQAKVEQQIEAQKDRNLQAKMKTAAKASMDIKRLAQQSGLQQDEEYLRYLSRLLEFGYGGHFEIQVRPIPSDPITPFFSAVLKRECLREDELLIVKKNARRAQGNFSLVGIVCQGTASPPPYVEETAPETRHLKKVLRTLVFAFAEIENSFLGRLDNEVIVDPVAVYREL